LSSAEWITSFIADLFKINEALVGINHLFQIDHLIRNVGEWMVFIKRFVQLVYVLQPRSRREGRTYKNATREVPRQE